MSFKLHVDDLADLSVTDVTQTIENKYKIPFSELKLFDLLVDENKSSAMRHGIYMFFNDDGECIYVGMCSSSHFAHRIGGHFGMSPKYDINTFLNLTVKMSGLENTYSSYIEVPPKIAEYRLLIIGANGKGKNFIKNLKKLFHIIYSPKLNPPNIFPKTYKPVNLSENFALSVSIQ